MKKRMPIAAQRVVTWRFGEGKDPRANTAIVWSSGPDAGDGSSGVYNAVGGKFRLKVKQEDVRKLKEKAIPVPFQETWLLVPPLCCTWDEPTRLSAVMNPV